MEPDQQQRENQSTFVLPILIFGSVEIHRIQRELEALENYLRQASLRNPGQQIPLPKTSRLLESLAQENHINLLTPGARDVLMQWLDTIVKTAPVMHISFAADPSSAFMVKIVEWFRKNVHPYSIIQLGLQPSLAAGFVLRTSNKQFDFSLQAHFAKQGHFLVEAMEAKVAQ